MLPACPFCGDTNLTSRRVTIVHIPFDPDAQQELDQVSDADMARSARANAVVSAVDQVTCGQGHPFPRNTVNLQGNTQIGNGTFRMNPQPVLVPATGQPGAQPTVQQTQAPQPVVWKWGTISPVADTESKAPVEKAADTEFDPFWGPVSGSVDIVEAVAEDNEDMFDESSDEGEDI